MRSTRCVAVVVLASACGDGTRTEPTIQTPSSSSSSSSSAGTFTATGVVALTGGARVTRGDGCTGAIEPELYGFSDIRAGTKLVVRDDSGKHVAFGRLGRGSLADPADLDPNPDFQDCVFPFTVEDIPGGSPSYFVAVGDHRGGVEFTEEQSDSLEISIVRLR